MESCFPPHGTFFSGQKPKHSGFKETTQIRKPRKTNRQLQESAYTIDIKTARYLEYKQHELKLTTPDKKRLLNFFRFNGDKG